MKWFKILKEQPVYLKLALISFWQKSGQNWLNGGHFKKNKFLNLNLKLRNRKSCSETDEILGSQVLSMITAKHFLIFQKNSKNLNKFKNFKFALISETVREQNGANFKPLQGYCMQNYKFWNFGFAAFWLANKHFPLFHL